MSHNLKGENQLSKLGIGVIGTGDIARVHIKCVHEVIDCQLIAIASSSKERAEMAEKEFGVPAFASYDQLLEHPDIKAVIICTESGNHLNPTILAARKGIHVLVEKPLEVTLERAEKMISECASNNVFLSCIFQNRFSPDYIRLKDAVKKGAFGKIHLANAYIQWYRTPEYYSTSKWKGTKKGDGGAAFINQGIHTIDLLIDLVGEASSIIGKTKTVTHKIEGEDLGIGLISFKNGALGCIQASTAIYPGQPERLEIFGSTGTAILEAGKLVQFEIKDQESTEEPSGINISSGSKDPKSIGHELHKRQIANFVDSIKMNKQPEVSGTEAIKALKIILKLYESSEKNQEIHLD